MSATNEKVIEEFIHNREKNKTTGNSFTPE